MDQETKEQLARQYQTSIEDIRLFKNTQWRITTTCYVVLGAIIGFSDKLKGFEYITYSLIALIAIVFIIALAGMKGVCETNISLNQVRDVIQRIRETYTPKAQETISDEYIKGQSGSGHKFFPHIFYVAIGIAAAVTELFIVSILLKS